MERSSKVLDGPVCLPSQRFKTAAIGVNDHQLRLEFPRAMMDVGTLACFTTENGKSKFEVRIGRCV